MSQFPTTPAPTSLKISSIQPTLVSVAHSLQRQVRSRGGHRWMLTAAWTVMTRAEWAVLYGFSQAQRGQFSAFTFVLPGNLASPQGVATGTPRVNGAGQSGRSVNTQSWTPSTPGILKAGDFLKFTGHAKVYMLTADATSDGSGHATLAIEPALFVAPVDNEAISVAHLPFTVSFASDNRDSNAIPGGFYDFTAEMVEVP